MDPSPPQNSPTANLRRFSNLLLSSSSSPTCIRMQNLFRAIQFYVPGPAPSLSQATMPSWQPGRKPLATNNVESILTALDQIQSLLSDGATYAVGDEFTIADISIGPWLGRLEMLFENDFFGKFEKAIVGKVHEIYKSLKYDKLREYNRRLQERPSVKKTYRKVRYLCSLFNNSKVSYQRISKGRRFAILPHKTISEIMNVIFVRDPCI